MASSLTPDQLLRQTAAPIGKIGAAFYFRPHTIEVGKQHGLSTLEFYLAGRAGVLGEVDPAVVQAAFGYFNPEMVSNLWNSAKQAVDPVEAATLHLGCAQQAGRDLFESIDPNLLTDFTRIAAQIISQPEDAALTLFSAFRTFEVPADDPAAAAMHQAVVLREYRGSVHLVAVIAQGLASRSAQAIKRPDEQSMFGWTESIEPTDDERERWARAEELTNVLLLPAYAGLAADDRDTYLAAVEAMQAAVLAQ